MMVRAYFYDQGRPAIGCGWRLVIVEREGPVWVRLINPHTLAACKVRRREWDEIGKATVTASRRELRKKGLAYIDTIDRLALGVDDTPKAVAAHKARVDNLKARLRRALKAL